MTKNCGAPCPLCAQRCDIIGLHDEHGHDQNEANHAAIHGREFAFRFLWEMLGGIPATCGLCGLQPPWILAKVPEGRRPMCAMCFTTNALKRAQTAAVI